MITTKFIGKTCQESVHLQEKDLVAVIATQSEVLLKRKKGIGLKTTGKTKRRFYPNMVTKRLWSTEEKRFLKMKISASALRLIDKLGLETAILRAKSKGL